MSVDIVTDKYSTAIFELAQEQQILEQMETDLSYVKEVMDTQPELGTLLLYRPSMQRQNAMFGQNIRWSH